jgi:hypothetical protein
LIIARETYVRAVAGLMTSRRAMREIARLGACRCTLRPDGVPRIRSGAHRRVRQVA